MPKEVTVTVNGNPMRIPDGEPLRSFLSEDFPCGGNGRCGKCKVKIKNESAHYCETEKQLLTQEEMADGIHLACTVKVFDGLVVETFHQNVGREHPIASDHISTPFLCKPKFSAFGVAVDIGTTTLAAKLYDRDGAALSTVTCFNPQSRWGADVISRIQASLSGEAKPLTDAIVESIDNLMDTLAADASISTNQIDEIVITGNTVMLSILTSTSVDPLAHAPFQCERLFGEYLTAKDIGLSGIHRDTMVFLPRCVGAFIGADVVTSLVASGIFDREETQLLIDIGTNGEIALWHQGKLYVCSTAAGPAFEGGGIYMGMPGGSGAIDHVEAVEGKLVAHTIDETEAKGICGSGIIDAVAALLETGLLDESGYLENGRVQLTPSVCVTQSDIRAVQLSKSAICSGMMAIFHRAGIDCSDIKKMYVAGGFGSYMNIRNAAAIGLFPTELTDKVSVIGNAALGGASMMLLNGEYRNQARQYTDNAILLDLSKDPYFMDQYVENMMFNDQDT